MALWYTVRLEMKCKESQERLRASILGVNLVAITKSKYKSHVISENFYPHMENYIQKGNLVCIDVHMEHPHTCFYCTETPTCYQTLFHLLKVSKEI